MGWGRAIVVGSDLNISERHSPILGAGLGVAILVLALKQDLLLCVGLTHHETRLLIALGQHLATLFVVLALQNVAHSPLRSCYLASVCVCVCVCVCVNTLRSGEGGVLHSPAHATATSQPHQKQQHGNTQQHCQRHIEDAPICTYSGKDLLAELSNM